MNKNIKLINQVSVMSLGLLIVACGKIDPISSDTNSLLSASTTVAASISQPAPSVDAPTNNTVSSDPITGIALTYYSKTMTEAPVSGWIYKTYTATGSCVIYLSKTYCWDDGMKTIDFTANQFHYGPYTYTYWGMGLKSTGSPWGPCYGGCEADLLAQPTIMTNPILIALPNPSGVTEMFFQGTSTQVTCTESNGLLNCGDFTIDLNQGAL
jgi:hypothetical protein